MKSGFKIYWGAMVLDFLRELNNLDLGRGDYKVLFFVLSEMNSQDNIAYIKQKDIARELGMDPGNVSKAVKRLVEYQFFIKVDNGFMVNPHLFYVGKGKTHDRISLRTAFDERLENPIYRMNEEEWELEIDR